MIKVHLQSGLTQKTICGRSWLSCVQSFGVVSAVCFRPLLVVVKERSLVTCKKCLKKKVMKDKD